jgi:hypothetical protein
VVSAVVAATAADAVDLVADAVVIVVVSAVETAEAATTTKVVAPGSSSFLRLTVLGEPGLVARLSFLFAQSFFICRP